MIFIGVLTAIAAMTVILCILDTKFDWDMRPYIIFIGCFVMFFGAIIVGAAIPSGFSPNQINNHKASLQSLVQQAGGSGESAYVRVDYTNDTVPDQVVTYAAGGKLHRVDGAQTIIRTVKDVSDARVVRQEFFAHYPYYVPWYSATAYDDRYVIYVPRDKIIYGSTDNPISNDD